MPKLILSDQFSLHRHMYSMQKQSPISFKLRGVKLTTFWQKNDIIIKHTWKLKFFLLKLIVFPKRVWKRKANKTYTPWFQELLKSWRNQDNEVLAYRLKKKKLKTNKIPKWSRIASLQIDSIYGQCGFLSGSVVKNLLAMQEPQEMQVDAWARKIPWRRTGQQTAVSLPGESHGQRSLAGYSP